MYLLVNSIFEEIKPINVKVRYIHCGGCGVFAEHLYDLFAKLGHKPKLVIITNSAKDMDKRVKGKAYTSYPSLKHIIIKIDKYYVDNLGVYAKVENVPYFDGKSECCKSLTIDKLREWNGNASMWNDTFNRKHISTITKKINNVYKKFAKIEK